MTDPVLVVGDVMWFSVELLRQIADEPNPVKVRVREIRIEADGCKMLTLERAEQVEVEFLRMH